MIDQPSFLDAAKWPETLDARVVDFANRRIHGYDLEADLVTLPLGALSYLSIVGELPSRSQYRLFEIASWNVSLIGIDSAPVHAAVLGQLVGATPSAVHGAAALGLTEWADHLVSQQTEVIEAIRRREAPRSMHVDTPSDLAFREKLLATIDDSETHLRKGWTLSRHGHALALFVDSGLKTNLHLIRAVVAAALPVVLAEAFAAGYGTFLNYPVNVPRTVPDVSK